MARLLFTNYGKLSANQKTEQFTKKTKVMNSFLRSPKIGH